MSKKKLLVLSSTYPRWPGDPEPGFVHELAKRLTTQFEVRVLCPHARGAVAREILEDIEVIRYRYAPIRFETLVNDGGIVNNLKHQPWKWLLVPFFLLGLFWHTRREIHHWRPNMIHAHWLLPQGLIVALLGLLDRHSPPFLVTSHGADLFAMRTRPLTALKCFVARRAAALTVVSHAMTNELARIGVPTQKISVLPMGVDLTHRFTPAPDQPRSHDEILFVGRFVEKKGLRHLLAAMPEIIARHPSAFLTIVGFGPEESNRRAQTKALGLAHKVKFLGPLAQAELPALYRRAAVFVAPFAQAVDGDREGLGLVTIEAIACDCPVVVSALPAVLDVLNPKTDAAMLASPGDVTELVTRINTVLATPEHARSKARELRKRLQQSFDWQNIATRYATLFDSIGQGHER